MSRGTLQNCTMCSFCTPEPSQLLNHVYTIHRHDPNFHIYCNCCMRSYKKLSAYRKHVSRGCGATLPQDTMGEPQSSLLPSTAELLELEQSHDCDVERHTISQQWHEARFILSIKEEHVLSQVAVDQVRSSTMTLVSSLLDNITSDLRSKDPGEVVRLVEQRVHEAKTMFSGLSTSYQQRKYFSENFNLVVRTYVVYKAHIRLITRSDSYPIYTSQSACLNVT